MSDYGFGKLQKLSDTASFNPTLERCGWRWFLKLFDCPTSISDFFSHTTTCWKQVILRPLVLFSGLRCYEGHEIWLKAPEKKNRNLSLSCNICVFSRPIMSLHAHHPYVFVYSLHDMHLADQNDTSEHCPATCTYWKLKHYHSSKPCVSFFVGKNVS